MNEKILFQLPIYSMSEEVFSKKWAYRKKEMINEAVSHGHSLEDAQNGISLLCYPCTTWLYNQIIGYITVSITPQDVLFNKFCSLNNFNRYDSKTKQYIVDFHKNGWHLYVRPEDDNKAIVSHIMEWLSVISKE